MEFFDVIVIGAGAAGMMAAMTAGQNGAKVLLIDHSTKIGEKIRISGGGRCNFTNLGASPKNYLSQNPHFAISALSNYTQHDFIKLVEKYKIAYHEKTLGQLFCDHSSKQIIDMLVAECNDAGVKFALGKKVNSVKKSDNFIIKTDADEYAGCNLIISTGGLAIPKLGSTGFGYDVAKQFGINVIEPYPALVPLTFSEQMQQKFKELSGIAIDAIAEFGKTQFRENILFTHKGLSGPAILQISSYMKDPLGKELKLNLSPLLNLNEEFKNNKNSKMSISGFLKNYFPNRFVDFFFADQSQKLVDSKLKNLEEIALGLHNFNLEINGTEGYLKAEVTGGGVDTNELSSKTMESKKVKGLYFIGEVVDVTGWLGGYNFQWAWSSGYAAGMAAVLK